MSVRVLRAVNGFEHLAGKAPTVHSHATSDVTGLDEQVRDVVGTALVVGDINKVAVGMLLAFWKDRQVS